ncbi:MULTISPECIES: hypothetical protein [Streptomyces]|uniref:hypothetical protein n=1 Tax=Streptomyces TaxID=1883 RepID=UPI000A38400F|nr:MULTISPECIES: hypothetical protein [Streptomyces]MDX3588822.1 hypothetical protein [Streptomyces europaeiscabiei]MDX3637160.1 hypothetical protein [Streptomyces europaeiscabiei]MDX3654848.1 hypothetical protein [Streptomyces europaeiscabiei]
MPRRRPGRIRAQVPDRRRSQGATPAVDRLSPRALSEIVRLERTRNYLQPGDISEALHLWKEYVHLPERQLWHDYEYGNVHWYCCGNPLERRALLDGVIQALSPKAARELRRIINRLDAFMGPTSPVSDGR